MTCNNCNNCDTNNCKTKKCEKSEILNYSRNRTINALNNAINYKCSQISSLSSLRDILHNAISTIQGSYCNNKKCYKNDLLYAIEQYISISNRIYDAKKLFILNDIFYGTVKINSSGDTYIPEHLSTGFGGILDDNTNTDKDNPNLPLGGGDLIIDLNGSNQHTVNFAAGNDVAFLANKIRKSICKKLGVVDGTEISLSFTFGTSSTPITIDFRMEVFSIELGNTSYDFQVISTFTDNDYLDLIQVIKQNFDIYINKIWFDITNKQIRIIFNAGYTVGIFSNPPSPTTNSIIFKSYINDYQTGNITIINQTTPIWHLAYGYLEFYSTCWNPIIQYPTNSLTSGSPTDVQLQLIRKYVNIYCANVTLNLGDFWCCYFKTIAKLGLAYEKCHDGVLDIKACMTYGLILRNMANCLKFDCSAYDQWRRENVVKNLESLINLLEDLPTLANGQKELFEIMKNDYIKYICKCNNRMNNYSFNSTDNFNY